MTLSLPWIEIAWAGAAPATGGPLVSWPALIIALLLTCIACWHAHRRASCEDRLRRLVEDGRDLEMRDSRVGCAGVAAGRAVSDDTVRNGEDPGSRREPA